MKTVKKLWIQFIAWLKQLFSKKNNVEDVIEPIKKGVIPTYTNPTVPAHNNRKSKKGRFVQYINVGAGRTRPVYHSSK